MKTRLQPVSVQRKQDGTFAKGSTGNPSGRPAGARNRVARALDAIADADAAAVLMKAIALAKDGDIEAVRLVLRHAWPVPRGRAIEGLTLPALKEAADAASALAAIMAAVAAGDITPDEGRDLSGIVENFRKTHELVDIEQRVAVLEKARASHARAARE